MLSLGYFDKKDARTPKHETAYHLINESDPDIVLRDKKGFRCRFDFVVKGANFTSSPPRFAANPAEGR